MTTLRESTLLCPRDGKNLFDVTAPDGNHRWLCKQCDQREFFEALKAAERITLDKSPSQRLKL